MKQKKIILANDDIIHVHCDDPDCLVCHHFGDICDGSDEFLEQEEKHEKNMEQRRLREYNEKINDTNGGGSFRDSILSGL